MAIRPMVSIITPILNGARTLDKCIQSVLNHNNPLIEHVFVDGGSTDGTDNIINSYNSQFPDRVKFFSRRGTSVGEAAILGLQLAEGEILGFLGADDFSEEGAIPAVIEFFKSFPEAYFVHGHCDFVDEFGGIIRQHRADGFHLQDFINTAKHIATPSAFFKRGVLDKSGLLDSDGDDFDMMIRIARQFEIFQLDKVLSKLTIIAGSAFNSTDPKKRFKNIRDTFEVSRRYGGSLYSKLAMRYYRRLVFHWFHLDPFEPQYVFMSRWIKALATIPTRNETKGHRHN